MILLLHTSSTSGRILARQGKKKQGTTSVTSGGNSTNKKNVHQDSTGAGNPGNHHNKPKQDHDAAKTPRKKHKKNKTDAPPELDCGSFIVRERESMMIFDDYVEFDPSNTNTTGMSAMSCQQMQGGEEFCFGGDDSVALWVHGNCRRGVGKTTITFSAMAMETNLVFACGGSPEAIPSVKCSICQSMQYDNCQFAFRAAARFGILDIPTDTQGKCDLFCKMPTTNE